MQDKSGSYIWWHIPITLTHRKLSEADQLHSKTVLITKGGDLSTYRQRGSDQRNTHSQKDIREIQFADQTQGFKDE